MENLHPAAQVAAIIMGGLFAIAWIISITDSWGKIFGKKKK